LASDAFENVVGDRRGDRDAVANEKNIFGGAFANVPVVRENDAFIKAGALCIGFGEGRVDVRAGDLAARRNIKANSIPTFWSKTGRPFLWKAGAKIGFQMKWKKMGVSFPPL
jgi:hypothetical protein